ncbi:hypothetical protein PR048_016205 [Dryococelus australis]|uniref:Uncharacterized protein n=1 Tax=Dryococelus australis TaxID=614101 RepID=A0ABQ9HK75_9NEOP|nr:hypothetical protein PR048_016205 [Dryococelus australis]
MKVRNKREILEKTRRTVVSFPHAKMREPIGSIPSGVAPRILASRMWESCRTMPLARGFSHGSPVFPAFAFQNSSILISLQSHRLPRSRCLESDEALEVRVSFARIAPSLLDQGRGVPTHVYLTLKSRPNISIQQLRFSSVKRCLSGTHRIAGNHDVFGGQDVVHWWRVDFQCRGSPHLHMAVLVRDRPESIQTIDRVFLCEILLGDSDLRPWGTRGGKGKEVIGTHASGTGAASSERRRPEKSAARRYLGRRPFAGCRGTEGEENNTEERSPLERSPQCVLVGGRPRLYAMRLLEVGRHRHAVCHRLFTVK